MSSLSVAIMAHPKRMPFVRELQEQLPDAELVLDRQNDRWDTGSRSLAAFDPDADFHLVVQDDAVLCRDLVAGAELVAKAAGDRPVALYTGKVRPYQHTVTPAVQMARQKGIPWVAFNGPWWGVGVILPTSHILELIAWVEANRPATANYDRRIAAFYEAQGIHCWYTVPSLVDHREVGENPSLVANRGGNRTAHWFIGEDSPLDIDWSIPPLPLFARFVNRGRSIEVPAGGFRHRKYAKSPYWTEVPA